MTMDWLREALAKGHVLAEKRTGGMTYRIIEKGKKRIFTVNGLRYSALDSGSYFSGSFHDYFMPLPLLYGRARVLVIGLGTGTIPYLLARAYGSRVSIDAVELDRECIRMTKKFLPKRRRGFKVIFGDGAEYVRKCRSKYDIIMQDAYMTDRPPNPQHIPRAFLEDRFMAAARNALADDGILAINYAPSALYLPFYLRRLRRHFGHVYRIRHIFLGNYILICSKRYDKRRILQRMGNGGPTLNRKVRRAYGSMH